jgi:hypothetical protein
LVVNYLSVHVYCALSSTACLSARGNFSELCFNEKNCRKSALRYRFFKMATCSKYIPPGVDSEGVYMWKAVEGIIEKYDLYQIVLQIVSNCPILSSSLIIQYILSQDYHSIKYAIFNFHNTIYNRL